MKKFSWMIPDKRQWRKWTLPSKSSYVGAWLALAALIYGFAMPFFQNKVTSEKVEEALLRTDKAMEIAHIATRALAAGQDIAPESLEQLSKAVEALGHYGSPDNDETERAIELLKLGKVDAAKSIFERIVESSTTSIATSAEAHRHIGAITFLSDPSTSLQAYQRSVELDPNNGDGWIWLGHLFFQFSRHKEANEAYSKALEISRKSKDTELEAVSLGNLGSVLLKQDEFQAALEIITESLTIDQKLNRWCGIADSYNNLGYISLRRESVDDALEYLRKSQSLNIKYCQSKKAEEVGRNIKAAEQFKELSSKKKQICDELLMSISHPNRENSTGQLYCSAEIRRTKGEPSAALKNFRDLLSLNLGAGNKEAAVWDYIGLGDASLDLNELSEANQFYEHALSLSKEFGNKLQVARSYLKIADVRMANCQLQRAIVAFKNAFTIFSEVGATDEAMRAEQLIGKLTMVIELIEQKLLDRFTFDNRFPCNFEREQTTRF